MRSLIINTITILILFLSSELYCEIIHIPDDEETFQAAIDTAEEGDTILVADGDYSGAGNRNLVITIPIFIISENGPEECIIDCDDDESRKAFDLREQIAVNGFTIVDADTGIYAADSDGISISNCIITGSTQFGLIGLNCSELSIVGCNIIENEPVINGQNGAGIRLDNCNGLIDNCSIIGNTTLGSGAGIYLGGCEITIDNTEISNNIAGTYGGGALITTGSICNITDSDFSDNLADLNNGGGIAVTNESVIEVEHCRFSSNFCVGSGGAVYLSSSDGNFHNVIFEDCEATRNGGGVLLWNNAYAEIINCLFWENSSGIDGGGLSVTNFSSIDIGNCDFIGNEAGQERDNGMGGGIYFGSSTNSVTRNSILIGNDADIGLQIYCQNANDVTITNSCIEGGIDPDDDWEFVELVDEDNIDDDPILVEGREPEWGMDGLFLDPDSPCIDAGSATAEEIGFDNMTTQANFDLDEDLVDIGFHYSLFWFRIVGRLIGTVIDASNDGALAGVRIETSFGQSTFTDEDGIWEIPEAIAALFDVTAYLDGYNDLTIVDRELEENEELEINFELLHPECTPSDNAIASQLNLNEEDEIELEIENTGNGILTWNAHTEILIEDELNPWTLMESDDPVAGLDAMILIEGLSVRAMETEDNFIISVVDENGDELNSFNQPGGAESGMVDLAWDGELLWGAREDTIYRFDFNGEIDISFEGPARAITAITWDSDRDLIWACGTNTNITGYDIEGNDVQELDNPDLRIRGLAYHPGDPDDRNLYLVHDRGDNPRQAVYNMNTANGNSQLLAINDPEGGGRPDGAFISFDLNPPGVSLIIVSNVQNGGRSDYWHIDYNRDWLSVSPIEGVLQAGETAELALNLDSNNLPESVLEGQIVVDHDAEGGQTLISVTLEIISGPVHTIRRINLKFGWNLISMYLQPDDADVRAITAELVDNGTIIMLKDQLGHFYYPSRNDFNNMDDWSVEQGYWILMNSPDRLSLEGTTVTRNEPINLNEGWQNIAYYPHHALNPQIAFTGIMDELILAKDGEGNFISPEYQFNCIPRCSPGNGYQLNVSQEIEFIWGIAPEEVNSLQEFSQNISPPIHLGKPVNTGENMSLLILTEGSFSGEICVIAGDILVGAGLLENQRCGISVQGDNGFTSGTVGCLEGDDLNLILLDEIGQTHDLDFDIVEGDMSFKQNSFTVVSISNETIPYEFELYSAFPNPFNSSTTIRYQLKEAGIANLRIFDISGREVQTLSNKWEYAGSHQKVCKLNNSPSGIYFVRLETKLGTKVSKITLLK